MAAHNDVVTFARLSDEQRGIAWAVVRSIATSLWVALAAMATVWLALVASDEGHPLPLWSLVPIAGLAGMTAGMEAKSRDLEKPVS